MLQVVAVMVLWELGEEVGEWMRLWPYVTMMLSV
jgi:hypothetical protein